MRPTHTHRVKSVEKLEDEIRAFWRNEESVDLYDAIIQYALNRAYVGGVITKVEMDTDRYNRLVFQVGIQLGFAQIAKISADEFIETVRSKIGKAIIRKI